METPSRFTFSPDGSTTVFQIPVQMKGDNYVRIDINNTTINDRNKFDIVNNSIVFVSNTDVPAGSQLDILVVQTDEGIANLGNVTSIDIVAQNILSVSAVGTDIAAVVNNSNNMASILAVNTNMPAVVNAVQAATDAAASEAAAKVSEDASKASENAAKASENASKASENAASASETAAAGSASAANTSLSNALAAELVAIQASADADTAKNAAKVSEDASKASENAAKVSENASKASENAAAASETAAANSASNASTSASDAASSATAASNSQVAAAASAASAASAYDSFDDRYLGSKASDPTLDNDGNPLVAGALYFNTTLSAMQVYDGGNWITATSAGGASLLTYSYTATAGQTTFSGTDENSKTLSYTLNNLIVTLNGIVLEEGTDYTASNGTSIVLPIGATVGDELNIVAFKSFTTADMVSATNGGTFLGNVTFDSDINVTGTVDGRNVSADGSKLDGIEAGATNYVHPANHPISVITGLQAALDGKVDDSQVLTNVPAGALFTDTNTTYSVGDGGLTQKNFTTALKTKLDGIAAGATSVPASTIIYVAQNTAPAGYLKANGAAVSRTTYADLFAAIGTTFGTGNGSTTFNLPDLRGEFIRGWDDSRGVDSGRGFGSAQADEFEAHNHSVYGQAGGGIAILGSQTRSFIGGQMDGAYTNSSFGTKHVQDTGGSETRPRNIALLACIKY